tara:strand:+ start:1026 stop:1529 length:504 start_codon:yes stop_codon:yes gene_type:complete
MELLEKITLGSSTSIVTFSGIPQDGTDLVVLISARGDRVATEDGQTMKLNTNPFDNFYAFDVRPASGAATSEGSDRMPGAMPAASSVASTFSSNQVYLGNYANSEDKLAVTLASKTDNTGSSSNRIAINSAIETGTDTGITSISLQPRYGSNYVAQSTFSLYKITAG